MCDLVAVNESPDPAVIELAEIEVEDSSYQFEVGEKFASFENQNLKLERHKNAVFPPSFGSRKIREQYYSLVQGKGELRGPLNQS